MTIVAHIGHWYHVLLYLAPVALVGGGLWYAGRHLPDEDEDGFESDEFDDGADDPDAPGDRRTGPGIRA